MSTIWKYELQGTDLQVVEMPLGARLLTVQVQDAQPCLWALVDPTADTGPRRIRIFGTGHPIAPSPASLRFIATFQLHGVLVFHAFEEMP